MLNPPRSCSIPVRPRKLLSRLKREGAELSCLSMGPRTLRALLVLAAVLVLLLPTATDAKKKRLSGDEKIAQLAASTRDGVVSLTADTYDDLVLRPDRPYHLFLLFTATADKYQCDVCKYVATNYVHEVTDWRKRRRRS